MKEIYMAIGFGAGLVAGTLLYKHCQETKQLVNKGEKVVKEKVESMKEKVEDMKENIKSQKMQKPQKTEKE